ncbi:MAG: ATP-binding protein [Calditrichaeota bacterium]|nr:MAG: ATP-binding protein [Calditrichota bacterium]
MSWIERLEFQEALDILNAVHEGDFYWLHLEGAAGIGKSHLLRRLARHLREQEARVLALDAVVLPPAPEHFYQIALKGLFRLYPGEMRRFEKALAPAAAAALRSLRRRKANPGDEEKFLLEQMVSAALHFLAGQHRVVLIVDHLEAGLDSTRILNQVLSLVQTLPVVLLSAGESRTMGAVAPNQTLVLNPLNQRQTEQLVQQRLNCGEMAARLLTNKIFLKSRGNPRLLLAMLSAFFSSFQNAQEIEPDHVAQLQETQVHTAEPRLVQQLFHSMGKEARAVLSLLAALEQPVSLRAAARLLGDKGRGATRLRRWVDAGRLDVAPLFDLELLTFRWPAWRTLLRQAFQQDTPRELLLRLMEALQTKSDNLPLQMSHLYFRDGRVEEAVRLALSEAGQFWKYGHLRKTLNRLQFVSRHHHRVGKDLIARSDLLSWLADCYQRLGLNANALDVLQQLREEVPASDVSAWAGVHARMAQLLLAMDQLAEARFFLQELKGKKGLPAVQRAWLELLQGDLEYNLGHPSYALRRWLAAVETLPAGSRHRLARELFSRLQKLAAEQESPLGEQMDWLALFARRRLNRGSLKFQLALWEARLLFASKNYRKALSLLEGLVRQPDLYRCPAELLAARLLLAEVLATAGRWEKAARLLAELDNGVFPFLSPAQRLNIQLKRAIVLKELGRLGEALKLIQKADTLAEALDAPRALRMEIALHEGHVHLLVHNYLSAGDRLKQVHHYARSSGQADLLLSASLWLAWYAILQNRFDQAEKLLNEALGLEMTEGSVEWFNLLFYRIQFQLARHNGDGLAPLLEAWFREGPAENKFHILGLWMRGQRALLEGRGEEAVEPLSRAHQLAVQSGSRYLAYQVAKSLCRCPADNEEDARRRLEQLKADFQALLDAIEDPVLQRQFAESREKQEMAALSLQAVAGPAPMD